MNCDDVECELNCDGKCLSLAWASVCDCPDYLKYEKDQNYGDEYE